MNQKLIAEALGKLDDSYLEEALAYQPAAKRHTWVKWGAMAACFSLVCAAALVFLAAQPDPATAAPPVTPSEPGTTHPAQIGPTPTFPTHSATESLPPAVAAPSPVPSEPETLHISLGGITVNEASAPVSAAHLYYDPALHDEVPWDRETVTEYFGRDLTPTYVPAGLDAYEGNGTVLAVIRKEDGQPALDTVYYSYYQSFGTWEDGTPRYIGIDPVVRHGFTLTASKVGILNCGIVYIGPEDEVKTSDIAGVPVTIGYRAMSHGPYEPETHEPAGYYDLYVAEFELDGVQLQLVADEMELEDVVRVVASVICPGQEMVLDP